jgi:hypothetical protein
MMEGVSRHGYEVVAGTLDPILPQLEEAGYWVSRAEVVRGKRQKYDRSASVLEATPMPPSPPHS